MGKQQTSTSKTTLPGYVTDLGSYISNYGMDLGKNPPNVPLEGTAGFSSDQLNAFQNLRDLIGSTPRVGNTALDWTTAAATASPESINVGSVDPNRMDLTAYMKAAGGPLQTQLDIIQQQANQQRKQLEAQANMEGGGTRGGGQASDQSLVAQNLADMNTLRATNEATGTAYGNAFKEALDTGFKNATQIQLPEQEANAGYMEQMLHRLGAGAPELISDVAGNQNNIMTQIQALLGTGGMEQSQEQSILSRLFGQEQQKYQQPFNILSALDNSLASMRGTTDSTTTSTQPYNWLAGLLGGAAGGGSSGSGGLGGLLSSGAGGLGSLFSGLGSGAGSLFSGLGAGAGGLLSGLGEGAMSLLALL